MKNDSLIKHSIILHKVRYQVMRNWVKRFNSENWFSFIFMMVLLWLFWVGGFHFFRFLGRQFHNIPTVGDILLNRIMAFLFLALFVMTSFGDLITALSTMYMSRDLPLLHSHPIRSASIFMEKFVQTVYYGAWAVVCFGIPIYFAYGKVLHAPWYFYPVAILSNIPFLIISAGIAILATLILAYVLPANRARTMIVALYGLSFLSVMIYIRLINTHPGTGLDGVGQTVEQFLFNLTLTTNPYMPNYWINQVFQSAVNRNVADMFFYLGLLCTTALLVIQVSVQLSTRLYYSGWTKSCESVQGTSAKRRKSFDKLLNLMLFPFSQPVRAVAIKDIKIFWRDLTQWGQFTLLMTLVLVYLYNTRSVLHSSAFFNQMVFNLPLKCLIGIFNLSLAGFVLANLAMRFVYTMISLEGRIIWVIRSSPFSIRRLFWSKFWLALSTMLFVGLGLIILANNLLQMDFYISTLSIIVVIMMSISLTSMAMGLGAMFPTFNVENPMQLSTGTGAVITVVTSLIYILVTIVLAAQPMIPYFMNGGDIRSLPHGTILIPLGILVIFNLVFAIVPIWFGIQRLSHRE